MTKKADLAQAKVMADFIEKDPTVGGIFMDNGDEAPTANVEAFKRKYDKKWWPIMRVILKLAKIFTNEAIDRVLDTLIALGDEVHGIGNTTDKELKP